MLNIESLKKQIEEDKAKLSVELVELIVKHRKEQDKLIENHNIRTQVLKDSIDILNLNN